jgi:hypothetical protein
MLEGVAEIPIYTPFENYEAAATLQKLLNDGKAIS